MNEYFYYLFVVINIIIMIYLLQLFKILPSLFQIRRTNYFMSIYAVA